MEGNNDISTTTIYAYPSCKPKKESLLPIYLQQVIYWKLHSIGVCTNKKFRTDVLIFIKTCGIIRESIHIVVEWDTYNRELVK